MLNRTAAKVILGTDEAGYGPTLGPLLVAASGWRVPAGIRSCELYQRLAAAVLPELPKGAKNDPLEKVVVADSKRLYHSGGTLALLERGVLAVLSVLGEFPTSWRRLCARFDTTCQEELEQAPWFAGYDRPLPAAIDCDAVAAAARLLQATCRELAIEPVVLAGRLIPASLFNRLLDRYTSKGELLSRATLELACAAVDRLEETNEVEITCDRHGGRKRYAALVADCFDTALVRSSEENGAVSRYEARRGGRRISIAFQTTGESHLATALASMACKYLRELAMEAFNAFWVNHVPGIPVTAGYPQDARRFLAAIEPARERLNIADSLLRRRK